MTPLTAALILPVLAWLTLIDLTEIRRIHR